MLVYTLRRINLFIITLLILTLIGYSILRLDPLSPWAIQDFFQGWTTYLGQLSQMNLGVNLYGIPVIDEIKMVFPATLELCFFAMIFSLMVGIPIGTLAGMRQGKVLDTIISFSSMVGYSIPIFWIALMMIMFFSLNLGYTPVSGRHDLLFDVPYITGFAVIDAFLTNESITDAVNTKCFNALSITLFSVSVGTNHRSNSAHALICRGSQEAKLHSGSTNSRAINLRNCFPTRTSQCYPPNNTKSRCATF